MTTIDNNPANQAHSRYNPEHCERTCLTVSGEVYQPTLMLQAARRKVVVDRVYYGEEVKERSRYEEKREKT